MSGIKDLAELTDRVSSRVADAGGIGTAAEIADAIADASLPADLAELQAHIENKLSSSSGLGTYIQIADTVNTAINTFVVAEGGTYSAGTAT